MLNPIEVKEKNYSENNALGEIKNNTNSKLLALNELSEGENLKHIELIKDKENLKISSPDGKTEDGNYEYIKNLYMNFLDNKAEEYGIPKQKLFKVCEEMGKNMCKYSVDGEKITMDIICEYTINKKIDENGKEEEIKIPKLFKIKTSNYFKENLDAIKNGGKTDEEKLNEKLSFINNKSINEVKEAYKIQLEKGEYNEETDGAGLGFLDVGKALKRNREKPFSWVIYEDKGLKIFHLISFIEIEKK